MLALVVLSGLLFSPAQDGTQDGTQTLTWSLPLREVAWVEPQEEVVTRQIEQAIGSYYWNQPSNWIVLEGEGEAFLYAPGGDGSPGMSPAPRLVATSRSGEDTRGALIFMKSYQSFWRLDFVLPAETASADATTDFELGRNRHYRHLLDRQLPGSAWFRHRSETLVEGRVVAPEEEFTQRNTELSRTFELFSGGRAVAENIQLDRLLWQRPPVDEGEEPKPDVALSDIEGITIQAFDWSELLEDVEAPELDPLLSWIPADQHALVMPSFQAFMDLVDELELRASPLIQMMEASASSARSRDALEKQLVLSLNGLTRFLGPAMIDSVAITGSDLYMRTGTDFTLLFDCKQLGAVVQHVKGLYAAAATKDAGLTRSEIDGVVGIESPYGEVSSFFAVEGDVLILSNSRAALARVRAAQAGHNLAQLEETRFFRDRYPRGQTSMGSEETAFLMISDATIRRWCGPKWRIAASHRLRALAALFELHATYAEELVQGVKTPRTLTVEDERLPDLGVVTLHAGGVHSSTYGSIGNLTPIIEMEMEKVSAFDARLYQIWRDGYARNWSQGFDPIAAQVSITDAAFEGDISVLPLIDNNDYNELRGWTGDARLGATDGDPHEGTLFNFALAIDPNAEQVLELQGMLSGFAPGEVSKFLGWMTGSLSFFADEDEIWDIALEAEDVEEAFESLFVELNDLPIGLTIGSSSPLKLASWMTALRGFAQGSSPGLTTWTPVTDDHENTYVRVGADQSLASNDEHLLYATLPEALLLALNGDAISRTMERFKTRRTAQTDPDTLVNPWLGESAALGISKKGIAIFGALMGESIGEEAQRATFRNLPILNEWKRLFPSLDPVAMHRFILGAELRCSGGGEFVWDDEWKTMSSTVFGSPAAPKTVPHLPPAIGDLQHLDAGLTFELDGLRARVRAQR
ncbi:MAG: hypothetical protein ACI8QS_000251 [Planctomycetota bacterium]|jgi:hypothetical protein